MYKKEGYWDVKPEIKRLSFPKRGKFQVDIKAAILICGMSLLTACTSGNEDNPVAPKPERNQYQLAHRSAIKDATGAGTSTDYAYDAQGRVISEMETDIDADGTQTKYEYYYTYSDHKIILDARIFQNVYTLNDEGLIVKCEVIHPGEEPRTLNEYQYDSEGKIISYEVENHKRTVMTWKDGDLISEETGDQVEALNRTDFIHSDLTAEEGFIMPFTSGIFNEMLYRQGYYGKTSKHLVAKVISKTEMSSTDKSDIVLNCTYTIADGHVTKMVEEGTVKITVGSFVLDKPTKTTYTYVWKENPSLGNP